MQAKSQLSSAMSGAPSTGSIAKASIQGNQRMAKPPLGSSLANIRD